VTRTFTFELVAAAAVVGIELRAGPWGPAKRHLHGDAEQGGDQYGNGGLVEQRGPVERAAGMTINGWVQQRDFHRHGGDGKQRPGSDCQRELERAAAAPRW